MSVLTHLVDTGPSGAEEPAAVEVVVSSDTAVSQVTLVGELDLGSFERVRDTLIGLVRTGCRHVEVDLSGLEFIDVVGARALLAANLAMRQAGGCLTVSGVHGTARRMFRITGYDRALDLG